MRGLNVLWVLAACDSRNRGKKQTTLKMAPITALARIVLWFVGISPAFVWAANFVPSTMKPPLPAREFRGVWIATVHNIDWPSRPGLTTAQQKAELVAILDRAVQLKLNAIMLQVRPACDALYASRLEPWSEYLTGRMGLAPQPFYDPLAFAVEEAHRRGLELHAWFNPFRARLSSGSNFVAETYVSKTHPHWMRRYGRQLWLDPGENAAQEYTLNVILDVVGRYDIDGVHLDDYFYPYPEKDRRGKELDFPDEPSWKRYVAAKGELARTDWRRENVDRFVQRLSEAINARKPVVKFGVSPFGIWRPGYPKQIEGFDAFDKLYADSRKWFLQGWLDYLAPQLYWDIEPPKQSYPALLKWWSEQNVAKRHLWPGNNLKRKGPGRSAEEIVSQIGLTRRQPGASGNLLWHAKLLMQNRNGVADALAREVYAQPALVPPTSWKDHTPPGQPKLTANVHATSGEIRLNWNRTGPEVVWLWILQIRSDGVWNMHVLPGRQDSCRLVQTKADVIALTALDRCANAGSPAVVEKSGSVK